MPLNTQKTIFKSESMKRTFVKNLKAKSNGFASKTVAAAGLKTAGRKLWLSVKGVVLLATLFTACKSSDTGDLIGVQGRRLWFHPQPVGMIYIPTGTYHSGQSDEDIFESFISPNKQVSVAAFWMDETEITNNEYRQFTNYVIDSIARYMTGEDAYFVTTCEGCFPEDDRYINHEVPLDWIKEKDNLEDMFYQGDERFRNKKQINTSKLFYTYEWMDLQQAAEQDRNKYKPMKRATFKRVESTLIYPDTLCWVRDFTYSFNDPMARHYFNHVKYDDYPVVGVSWHQAKAFTYWRTIYKNTYWESFNEPITEDFRLPYEFEWEYAARGGRNANKYPWGGPYTRNSKGCMLANFKPLRGNYIADGGLYPVRADSYFPNDWGLYNMAGNVAEWTEDTYEIGSSVQEHDLNPIYRVVIPEYVKSGTKAKPTYGGTEQSPITKKRKVIRGGSWKDIAYFIQNSARTFEYQDTSKSYVGFRCVQSYIGRSAKDRK